ncbi:hypothetical protein M4D79_23255 [Mycolicibacterium novocastrense]|nr:hypothetical protein M4D79_23255 [Mycolicibacterium novocastrense]
MARPWNDKIPCIQGAEEAQRLAHEMAQADLLRQQIRREVFINVMVEVAELSKRWSNPC